MIYKRGLKITLEEAIRHAETVAHDNERFVNVTRSNLAMPGSDARKHQEKRANECEEVADEYRQLAEWLKELKAIRKSQKWIPWEEKKPEDGQEVLVCREYKHEKNKYRKRYVEIAEYSNEELWSYSDEYKVNPNKHVTLAWMPTPAPYDEDLKDECKTLDKLGKYYCDSMLAGSGEDDEE